MGDGNGNIIPGTEVYTLYQHLTDRGPSIGLGNQNLHSSEVFANSFFAADVIMYFIDVYSDYSLAVNEGIRQGYRKALGRYSWTPGTLKNSNEFFKGLKAATGALGKASFGVGAGISLINMANNPTLENFAWGFADIGVGAIGLYSGAIAATLTTAGLAVPGLNLTIAGAALGYAGYRICSNWE